MVGCYFPPSIPWLVGFCVVQQCDLVALQYLCAKVFLLGLGMIDFFGYGRELCLFMYYFSAITKGFGRGKW